MWCRDEGRRTTGSFQAPTILSRKKAHYPPDHRTQIIGAHFNFIGFYSSSFKNKENILLEKPSRHKLRQQQERMTSTSLWKTLIFQGRINTLPSQERHLWYLLSETKVVSWLNSEANKWIWLHIFFSKSEFSHDTTFVPSFTLIIGLIIFYESIIHWLTIIIKDLHVLE